MKRIGNVVWAMVASAAATTSGWASDAAALTTLETKWLDAAEPVLAFALAQGLPIDVVVRPRSEAGDVPFSVGVHNSRCKLTLSMRDRPDAELTLADVPASQHSILIEAMTAHEIAHCWRYVQGMWNTLPAGFTDPLDSKGSEPLASRKQQMRFTQREEAYADLAALAWTQQQHAAEYEKVHAWLVRIRQDQPLAGSYHDTRSWLTLTRDASAFPKTGTPFEQVQELWVQGILATTEPANTDAK